MAILYALAAIAVIGVIYVLTPVALSVFSEFRDPKQVICPQNNEPARVLVDARHAAMTSAVGMRTLRLRDCSRWPHQGACDRRCLSQLEG